MQHRFQPVYRACYWANADASCYSLVQHLVNAWPQRAAYVIGWLVTDTAASRLVTLREATGASRGFAPRLASDRCPA
jgi:hypothetical protein